MSRVSKKGERKMKEEEVCRNCGRVYDGGYPCPDCGSINFIKEKELKKKEKEE